MSANQQYPDKENDGKLPVAGTGNASNPSPEPEEFNPANNNQLLDEKAGKYIREVSSPEDYPDPVDEQEMEKELRNTGTEEESK